MENNRAPVRRSYDHRLKDAALHTRNPDLFRELAIPRRTASRWAAGDRHPVVSMQELDENPAILVARLRDVETRCLSAEALLTMVTDAIKILDISSGSTRT